MPNKCAYLISPFKLGAAGLMTLAVCGAGSFQAAQAAEITTLFTTPEERQIINSNRYKTDLPQQASKIEKVIESPEQLQMREEITQEYQVSGITVSRDGPNTVWINTIAYEDGDQLDDKSKIKVMIDGEIRVRITTPDGKNYFATSGETLEVTYLAPVEG
jgi:hypothetical protein